MKNFKEKIDRMHITNEFKKQIQDINEEEGYDYFVTTSYAPTKLYKLRNGEIVNTHISHICEDYRIENRYECVASSGYLEEGSVVAELLFRKKINSLEKIGTKIYFADSYLIKEKFENIEPDEDKIYRYSEYIQKINEENFTKLDEVIINSIKKIFEALNNNEEFKLISFKCRVDKQITIELLLEDINQE